jgi:RimJ/RimL family protein N-acetyltransferase
MKTATLRGGARVTLRPIRPEDESELMALHARLSRETAYQRFLTVMPRLAPDWAHKLANVDYDRRMAILAFAPDGELIAVARYAYDEAAREAEVAFVVQDRWQGRGLGTILLEELLAYAQARGIERFRAYVLADNVRMLKLLSHAGEVREHRTEQGVVSLLVVRETPGRPARPGDEGP